MTAALLAPLSLLVVAAAVLIGVAVRGWGRGRCPR